MTKVDIGDHQEVVPGFLESDEIFNYKSEFPLLQEHQEIPRHQVDLKANAEFDVVVSFLMIFITYTFSTQKNPSMM